MVNCDSQRELFDSLVDSGIYNDAFHHSTPCIDFYRSIVLELISELPNERRLSVLDVGCGTGAWLEFLIKLFTERELRADFAGFDLSEKMIDVARRKLKGRIPEERLRLGNALDELCYRFSDAASGFDLVIAYDLVQQIPAAKQSACIDLIVSALRPGGRAVVFDHDSSSPYGRKMGLKKFITQYLFVPLVPRYYCNAQYPPLRRIKDDFEKRPNFRAALRSHDHVTKQALEIASIV